MNNDSVIYDSGDEAIARKSKEGIIIDESDESIRQFEAEYYVVSC